MISELVRCFDRTTAYIRELLADLRDDEMILQPPGVPNHGAWTLGHVILSCQAIARELGVSPWLPDDWESLFGYGSLPHGAVGSAYARRDVLASYLADASDRLRAALLATREDALRDPLPDPESREVFATTGDALLQVVCAHTAFHAGQLAAWRRAIGREPVGVFI